MSLAPRLLMADILARAKWVLLAMVVLQFSFALTFLGTAIPYSFYLVLPLMFLGLAPVLAPNRRLLQCMPIARDAIDHMQWLFSGGLVVIIITTTSLLAWFCATIFFVPSHGVNYVKACTLILGMPAVTGLFMMLRRWTTAGVDPDNQNRPLLLANYFWAPILILASKLIELSEFGLVTAVTITVLVIGFIALAIFLVAPHRYRAWITKPQTRAGKPRIPKRRFVNSVVRRILWISTFGGVLALLLAWLGPNQVSRAEVGIMLSTIATIPVAFGMTLFSALKVLRSVPRSLNRSTLILVMVLLLPSFATITIYSVACAAFGHPITETTASTTLPILAAIATFAPIALRIATHIRVRMILALVFLYFGFVVIATWEGKYIASLPHDFTVMSNVVAAIVIFATYYWMRHELRVGTLLYRYRSTSGWPY
jgi:hypothetical protein